jgi:hypothetical protein
MNGIRRNKLNIPICNDMNYEDYSNFIYYEVKWHYKRKFYIRHIKISGWYNYYGIRIVKDEKFDKNI